MHNAQQLKFGKVSTSEKEIKDLLFAWLAISAAFAIAFRNEIPSLDFYSVFIIASLTVGAGFLLHELGHKIVAQRFGCFAEFRSFGHMLLLAIAMSFFGFIFAMPGAVMISGRINKSRNGKISAAGPLVNLALALFFLMLIFLHLPSYFKIMGYYGFLVNSWLALFNMVPFWVFDGYKIFRWNKAVYLGIVAAALSFILLKGFIPQPA